MGQYSYILFKLDTMFYWWFQFSLLTLGRRGTYDGRFSRHPLPVSSAGGRCEQFSMGRDVLSFTLSIQQFLCWPRRPEEWFGRGCRGTRQACFRLLTVARRGSDGPTITCGWSYAEVKHWKTKQKKKPQQQLNCSKHVLSNGYQKSTEKSESKDYALNSS